MKILNSEELWKPVNGFEGFYEVSSLSRVRTVERSVIIRSKGNSHKSHPIKEKIKIQNLSKSGYRTVALVLHNKTFTTYVHRIVAQAFLPNPNKYKVINHKNGIKSDNRLENLEWCTSGFNNLHAIHTRLRQPAKAMLNEKRVIQIIEMYKQGLTSKEIAELINIPALVIRNYLNGRTYKWLKV